MARRLWRVAVQCSGHVMRSRSESPTNNRASIAMRGLGAGGGRLALVADDVDDAPLDLQFSRRRNQ